MCYSAKYVIYVNMYLIPMWLQSKLYFGLKCGILALFAIVVTCVIGFDYVFGVSPLLQRHKAFYLFVLEFTFYLSKGFYSQACLTFSLLDIHMVSMAFSYPSVFQEKFSSSMSRLNVLALIKQHFFRFPLSFSLLHVL